MAIDWLLWVRFASAAIWIAVALYTCPAAFAAGFRPAARRERDAMRLGFFAVACLMIGFAMRWYVVRKVEAVSIVLYALSAATGLYVLRLAHAYGRGDKHD